MFETQTPECDDCGNPARDLATIDGKKFCTNCQEDWDHRPDPPLTPDEELLYSDELAPCAREVLEQGLTVKHMLTLLRSHIVSCAVCGSTRRSVQDDGLYLGIQDPICCETEVA